MNKAIHVAVGVVVNANQDVLISLRAAHQHQGNRWEFPGGKVEAGESVLQSLNRELAEELGIRVQQAEPLCTIEHAYSDKTVLLDVWWVTAITGQVQALEGQEWRWVPADTLAEYNFPAANVPILQAIAKKLIVPLA